MKTKNNLDNEELEILEAFEKGLLQPSSTEENDILTAQMAAKNTVDACEEIKIELSVKDLQQLKKKALQTGISYQNLISFLIHKYIDKINVQIAVD